MERAATKIAVGLQHEEEPAALPRVQSEPSDDGQAREDEPLLLDYDQLASAFQAQLLERGADFDSHGDSSLHED